MTAADQFTHYERDPRAATSCPISEDMTMNHETYERTRTALLSAAHCLSERAPELSGAIRDRLDRGEIDAVQAFKLAIEFCRIGSAGLQA